MVGEPSEIYSLPMSDGKVETLSDNESNASTVLAGNYRTRSGKSVSREDIETLVARDPRLKMVTLPRHVRSTNRLSMIEVKAVYGPISPVTSVPIRHSLNYGKPIEDYVRSAVLNCRGDGSKYRIPSSDEGRYRERLDMLIRLKLDGRESCPIEDDSDPET